MMKLILSVLLLTTSSLAFAGTTGSVNQSAMYYSLLQSVMGLIFAIGMVLSLTLLLLLSILAVKQIVDKDSLAKEDLKPMTFVRFAFGLVMVPILFSPFSAIEMANDLTGLRGDGMCLVVDVSIRHVSGWENNAVACIEMVESSAQRFGRYDDRSHLEKANIPLLFGVIQALGLSFFLASAWQIGRHMRGVRNLKLSVGQSIVAMVFAAAVIGLPNIVDYIEDFGSRNEQPLSPP